MIKTRRSLVLGRALRHGFAIAMALGALYTVPRRLCTRRADAFFQGEIDVQRALGHSARSWLDQDPRSLVFHTGSSRFDGEWFLIVHMAAALGFAQTAVEHAELSAEHVPWATLAVEHMLLPQANEHDRAAWGEDPLQTLDGTNGHLAYLAYANLGLSMLGSVNAAPRFRSVNTAITDALARRFAASPIGLVESYPNETYPADNAVALASILLFDRVTGANHHAQADRGLSALTTRATEPMSGLLYQCVDARTGAPRDGARASGTAMAAFALGYADRHIAERLWSPIARQAESWLGFGGIREYPQGIDGHGDVDSGPLVLGLSVSASGFALASARRMGDRARYHALFASMWLFGLPATDRGGAIHFMTGGPLGDVLLFALLTAREAS